MDAIASVSSSTTQAAAVQAAQANAAAGTTQAQVAALGLPPADLAQAASINTVNAELVSSQWGIDPASVSGVYGDTGDSGGVFSSAMLLPLLTNLSHANAEQALALMGITTPTPGGGTTATTTAAPATTTPTTQSADATPAQSGPTQVDPLWGQTS